MLRDCVRKCTQQYRSLVNVRNYSNTAANVNIFDRVVKQVQKDRAFQR